MNSQSARNIGNGSTTPLVGTALTLAVGALFCGGCNETISEMPDDRFVVSLDGVTTDTSSSTDIFEPTEATTGDTLGPPPVDVQNPGDSIQQPVRVWSLQPQGLATKGRSIQAVVVRNDAGLVACGDSGLLQVFTLNEWVSLDTGENEDIAGCHAHDESSIVAVGDQGRVWRRVQNAWSNEDIIEESPGLRDVYMSSEDTFLVVGVAGTIYRNQLGAWSKESVESEGAVEAVHGASALEAATGDQMLLVRLLDTWVMEAIPEDPIGTPASNAGFHGRDIYVRPTGDIWAVGDNGKVVYRDGTGVWVRQDAKWQATAFQRIFGAPEQPAHALGLKVYRSYVDGEWTVPTIESPEFLTENPPVRWPTERKVPQQATLDLVGGAQLPNGDTWLFTKTGLWITYAFLD